MQFQNTLIKLVMLLVLSGCTISKKAIIQEPNYNKIDDYINHYAYSLVFNSDTKQAKWVAYKLNTYQTTRKTVST